MTRPSAFRLLSVAAAFAALSASSAAWAGKVVLTFTKPDPETWELHGLTDADFTPEGLRFAWPAGADREPKFILSKKSFKDDLEVLAELDRAKAALGPRDMPGTQAVVVLDNPEARRRAEMSLYDRLLGDGMRDTIGALVYFKDGVPVGRMAGWEKGGLDTVRLRKVAKRVFGGFPVKRGELIGWQTAHYPRTEFDEDTDEFRVGFMVVPLKQGAETEVVLKSLTITGPQAGGNDVAMNEPKVLRFDFGTVDQDVAEDYVGVTPWTNYTPERGYGWRTSLRPTRPHELKPLPNDEAVRLGYEPACAEEGWEFNGQQTRNWMEHTKARPMLAIAHGWDHIEELGKTYDLKTPQEKDLVYSCRPYGFPHNYRVEADQWERRGAIYIDDDLSTEFAVDVPNGRWNAIVGVGWTIGGPFWNIPTPFSIDAEGLTVQKDLRQNWMRCDRFKIEDIEVKDGQLNLRLFADRRLSMNEVEPANLGVGWLVNYLILCPAEDKEVLRQEEWRLIMERSKRVRQLTFEPGNPAHAQLVKGHMRLNGKPYLPVVLQYGYAWPRTLYGLYSWANCYTEGLASSEIGGSSAFFQKDWERMSMWDNYPWRAIAAMNSAVRRGSLDFLYCENFVYIVPRAIQGEGASLEDSRGRSNRWQVQPPLGSRLAMEIIKESYTMVSNQLKLHPANPGYYVYEEFVHPYDYGYDFQSLNQYREFLEEQYKTIDALNAEWGRQYKDFGEVPPPKRDWDEGPEWRNFWKFRRWAMELQARQACQMVRDLEPEHTTMGQKCKPDSMSTAWFTAADVDLFGGAGPPPFHQAGAKFFGKALTQCGGYWDCPWAWCDGRRQLDHKPKDKRYLGKDLLPVYNDTISRLFQGTKGFWCEEYNDGVRHMFHRTTLIKRDSELGKIKTWFGDIVFYDKEGLDFAPVTACLPPLRWARAVQAAYRLSPMMLPARPARGSVAVLYTEDSSLIRTDAAGNHQWLVPIDRLLTGLRVPYDLVRPENIDALKDYPIVILAGFTETVEPKLVDALSAHVARGGKVLMLDHALGYDARLLTVADPGPAFGFDKVAGFTYNYRRDDRRKFNGPAVLTGGAFLKAAKPGDTIAPHPYFAIPASLEPAPGATVVAKVEDKVVGVMNAEGGVLALSLPQVRVNWQGVVPTDPTFSKLVGDVLAFWGVRRPMDVKEDLRNVEVRAMEGDGYWLAAAMNHGSERAAATVTLNFLPAGSYDVVDVTGERPIVTLDDKKGMHLALDAEFRASRFVARGVSAAELASKGLALEIDGLMARVLLVRSAGESVWVDAPADVLRSAAQRADAVVVGDKASPAELAAAKKIVDAAKAAGTTLALRKASEIKTEKTRNEVRVSPDGQLAPKGGGYVVDVFANEPLVVEANLILVGSAETNTLVRHLSLPDTFTYDKVLEKVGADYPGKGRGLIGLVEGVTRPDYDASSFCRDAVIVGGSDDAGTAAAAEKFISLIR